MCVFYVCFLRVFYVCFLSMFLRVFFMCVFYVCFLCVFFKSCGCFSSLQIFFVMNDSRAVASFLSWGAVGRAKQSWLRPRGQLQPRRHFIQLGSGLNFLAFVVEAKRALQKLQFKAFKMQLLQYVVNGIWSEGKYLFKEQQSRLCAGSYGIQAFTFKLFTFMLFTYLSVFFSTPEKLLQPID